MVRLKIVSSRIEPQEKRGLIERGMINHGRLATIAA